MPSRFNKNGRNLSPDAEKDWLEANSSPVVEKEKPETTAKADADANKEEKTGRKLSLNPRRNRKGKENG